MINELSFSKVKLLINLEICPIVDLFCLKPFWEMRSRGSRIGLSLFRIMRL